MTFVWTLSLIFYAKWVEHDISEADLVEVASPVGLIQKPATAQIIRMVYFALVL